MDFLDLSLMAAGVQSSNDSMLDRVRRRYRDSAAEGEWKKTPKTEAQNREAATRRATQTLHRHRHEAGVALVDIEHLIRVMVDRIPEHMAGEERDGYVTAICDILVHINEAQVDHDPEHGFEKSRTPVRPRQGAVADTLGVKEYRTGAWAQKEGSSDQPEAVAADSGLSAQVCHTGAWDQ